MLLGTVCNIPEPIVRSNVAANLKRDLPRLHDLPDRRKSKLMAPIALVGGGPSLKKTLNELRAFPDIMVCSSAHDYVVKQGFSPKYAVVCDAHPVTASFLQHPVKDCTYLIASMCDVTVFDALKDHNVIMWNATCGDRDAFNGEPSIDGGCTGILRAILIADYLGWTNQHFFGLDSSFEDDVEYAYEGNPENTSPIIDAKVRGHWFKSTGSWLGQAEHFREMCVTMRHVFIPTVHGNGLIAAMLNHGDYRQ